MRPTNSTLLAVLMASAVAAAAETDVSSHPPAQPVTVAAVESPAATVEKTAAATIETPTPTIEKTVTPAAPALVPAKDATAEEHPAHDVAVGSEGLFRPGLLLQGWLLVDSATDTTSTFRLRRAEISLKGDILPKRFSYGVMIDPSRVLEFQSTSVSMGGATTTVKQPVGAVAMLQDFYVTGSTQWGDVSVGQFKIPISWEGFNSSSKLLFPERALVSKAFGDKRDLGLKVAKRFDRFGYVAGLYNGTGQNTLDNNNDKDASLRLEGYPVDGLVLAGAVYGTVGERKADVKDRYEADVRYEAGPLLLQAEFIRAHDVNGQGNGTDAQGFYGEAAWTFSETLQPCVRVGFLDPDVSRNLDPATMGGKDELWEAEVGVNYYLRKHEVKLQLAYARFQYESLPANNEVVLNGQVAF